jgi:aryl-alcohol dehydrogenase-like predicted oxidoreductase
MQLHRRQFLGTTALGAAGVLVAHETLHAQAAKSDADPLAVVPLGKRLKVTRIGMGTGVQGTNRSSAGIRNGSEDFEKTIALAYDEGIRLFDMADAYGSHPYVGKALKGKPRDSYVLTSKYMPRGMGFGRGNQTPEEVDVAIQRFLKEVGTDYLDLVQLHLQQSANWPDTLRKQMDIMEGLREKGIIRAHGVSCHSIPALEAAAKEPWVDVVHARINHKGVNMDDKPENVAPVLKKIREAGKGVIGMKTYGQGAWKDDPANREASLRFIFSQGLVDVAVIGMLKPEQVADMKNTAKLALQAKV